jgi:hypothetical protein
MKPTTIGSAARVVPTSAPQQALVPAAPIETGAIVLRPDQAVEAEKSLAELDFETLPSGDVIKIGLGAEQALQRTLDGFLARLDKNSASAVFALFGRLEEGVQDAKLPEILDKIQNGEKPGLIGSLLARFTGKRPGQLAAEALAEIGELISGRTKTLADQMMKLEGELSGEMQKLFGELQALEALKRSYGEHFGDFTVSAGVARAFLAKAQAYVGAQEAGLNQADPVARTRLIELKDKLRLLESRALALEGTYTRLPADQLVIQQIEQAGIATLQETATTVASRFASAAVDPRRLRGQERPAARGPAGPARQATDRSARPGAQGCRRDRRGGAWRKPSRAGPADRTDHCYHQRDPRPRRRGAQDHRREV